jgi:hypothetical protein
MFTTAIPSAHTHEWAHHLVDAKIFFAIDQKLGGGHVARPLGKRRQIGVRMALGRQLAAHGPAVANIHSPSGPKIGALDSKLTAKVVGVAVTFWVVLPSE